MTYAISPAAKSDLLDIALFIAEDNPARALTFVDELEARCAVAGQSPAIGTSRPDLGDGIRMLPHGRYIVFYRVVGSDVRIERILHSARDIDGDDMSATSPV